MRVAVVQPWLGHYRRPLYDLLGAQPGVELTVCAADARPPECAPGPGDSWRFVAEPIRERRILAGRRTFNFRYQPAQLAVMRREAFDLVVLTWDVSIWSVWPAMLKARARGMPVVLWGHGYSLHGGGVRDVVRNFLGRRGRAIMVYTEAGREKMTKEFGYDRSRVFVAQNALDQRAIRRARAWWGERPGELREFQREKGLDPAQTIIHVSRLIPEKNPAPLIRGMALLREAPPGARPGKRPGARLVIVGDGPTRPDLERLAAELGVANRVIFAGSIYDERRLAAWMLSATLMCYPFSAGLSLLHAFGYGLPVTTGDREGAHNPEIEALRDGESGLVYRVARTPQAEDDPASIEAMVGAWARLMDDPGLRARLAARAEHLATNVYTIENMTRGFLEALSAADGVRRELVTPPGWINGGG